MFGLAPALCLRAFLSFKLFDHLAWGRGSWSLCLSCICLLAMLTLNFVTFSLPPGVGRWLRLLLVALPGLFYLHFSSCLSQSLKNFKMIPSRQGVNNHFSAKYVFLRISLLLFYNYVLVSLF